MSGPFTATHRIDDRLWTLGGRYSYELAQSEDGCLVNSMTMTALWEPAIGDSWPWRVSALLKVAEDDGGTAD